MKSRIKPVKDICSISIPEFNIQRLKIEGTKKLRRSKAQTRRVHKHETKVIVVVRTNLIYVWKL